MSRAAATGPRAFTPRVARVALGAAALGIAAGSVALLVARPLAGQPPAGGPVSAVTLIHGLEEREEDLKQHLLSLSGPTRAEPGCLKYDLYQSPDRAHEFMRLEVSSSAEALASVGSC